jgi:hypothetical protein
MSEKRRYISVIALQLCFRIVREECSKNEQGLKFSYTLKHLACMR